MTALAAPGAGSSLAMFNLLAGVNANPESTSGVINGAKNGSAGGGSIGTLMQLMGLLPSGALAGYNASQAPQNQPMAGVSPQVPVPPGPNTQGAQPIPPSPDVHSLAGGPVSTNYQPPQPGQPVVR